MVLNLISDCAQEVRPVIVAVGRIFTRPDGSRRCRYHSSVGIILQAVKMLYSSNAGITTLAPDRTLVVIIH